MSTSRNANHMTSAQGQFHAHVPPSKPLTTKGHAPGIKVGKDAVPEFHAETHDPGTAPGEDTYEPTPDMAAAANITNAADTLTGSTSADLHTGMGQPITGMTPHHGKRDRSGLEGVGANEVDPVRKHHWDEAHVPGEQMSERFAGAGEAVPERAM